MLNSAARSGVIARDEVEKRRSGSHRVLIKGDQRASALVVLAGRLPADTQASSDVGPSDLQVDRVVDQERQFGGQFQPHAARWASS